MLFCFCLCCGYLLCFSVFACVVSICGAFLYLVVLWVFAVLFLFLLVLWVFSNAFLFLLVLWVFAVLLCFWLCCEYFRWFSVFACVVNICGAFLFLLVLWVFAVLSVFACVVSICGAFLFLLVLWVFAVLFLFLVVLWVFAVLFCFWLCCEYFKCFSVFGCVVSICGAFLFLVVLWVFAVLFCFLLVLWVLLWSFYQLFGLSFWRHPFTAEDPLLSKWCNVTFLQICSDEETNTSTPLDGLRVSTF